jgi:hypothetical protein
MALWYNELGNRIQEVQQMQDSLKDDEMMRYDPCACFMFGYGWKKEKEKMQEEMRLIERRASRDDDWEDHWIWEDNDE